VEDFMKIAVVLETVSCERSKDIIGALESRGHEIINAGMSSKDEKPELSYIHSGLLAAILLNTGRADLVIGGCGTGQGFGISAMQYPNVFCGHINSSLDAWLFAQINAGNCISLALTQGYGWAGEMNLKLIFDAYFSVKEIDGYPAHRKGPQRLSREKLAAISRDVHPPFGDIISRIDIDIIKPVLEFPGVTELLDIDNIDNVKIRRSLNILKDKIRK
jgi:ribose 5-phosphate isomerase RpiB